MEENRVDLIVTRHPALRQYLIELGVADESTPVITHVSDPAILRGKVVAGVLPLSLAYLCKEIWEVELDLTPEDRGKELTLERMREIARGIKKYKVVSM